MTQQPGLSRWRLTSIKIGSFRGVAGEWTYVFDGRPGLLHGNNGVGKSTVALSIQWTLYGKFPSEVLTNTSHNTFLAPVSANSAAWFGQATFQSGDRKLVITRDQAQKAFSLSIDGVIYEGEEAESQRERILGLDMAGFVRTVLLHQSRIRGLLLDSPKDRNEALDRLLGMDDIEAVLSRLKPKDFVAAASARRQKVEEEERRHHLREELLIEQRDAAQTRAREHRFLNKDFNNAGLKNAYAAIGESLGALAKKYEVEVESLPACVGLQDAAGLSSRIADALRSFRTKSKLQVRLVPIDLEIAKLIELEKSIKAALLSCSGAQGRVEDWTKTHGEHSAVVERREAATQQLAAQKHALKAAGELRQLIADGKHFVESEPSDHCPLCEQSVGSATVFIAKLSARLESLASQEISELEATVATAEKSLDQLNMALSQYEQYEKQRNEAQARADAERARIVEALGGQGIPEGKVMSRLEAALAERSEQRAEVAKGVAAMEDELTEVEQAERWIREGLLPVLKSRAELIELEEARAKTKEAHSAAIVAAAELEALADQLTGLRTALLEAKNHLASNTLAQASPRANELYQRLVRHPVFDALALATVPRANKIDYSFEVSSKGTKKSAREARLVLSDGQVTATAIGLFFAFSDTETHNLDLLYVDDPTQNLDLPCKEVMAKVVTELAQRRQVIVATQDEDFVSFLEAAGYFASAVVHHIERWDGNPVVKTKVAS